MLKLSSIDLNKEYIVVENNSKGLLRERLISLGFILDSSIYKIKTGKEINIYLIKGMMIALRDSEADFICVKSV